MAQQIRYKRRNSSEHPPEPSNIGFVILNYAATRRQLYSLRFYRQKQDIDFSVKFIIEVLATYDFWFIDGILKTIPELFYQLMTIHEKTTAGYFIPLVFIMSPSKTSAIYEKTFETLKLLQDSLNPSNIMVDFEQGLHKTLEKAFCGACIRGNLFQTLPYISSS